MSAESHPEDATNEYSSRDGFARLAASFESLRVLDEPERERALVELAATDPGMTTALRSLLAQHDDDPDAYASPDLAFARNEVADALRDVGASPAMPKSIGPYRIERALGHGGMGSVYLGEHVDPDLRRQVAVKVLRTARQDPNLLARFRTERRILGALQHPNIAALFEAGSTDDGQPFVAMEYVDGPDLMSWCDAERLPTEERVRLFVKVCRAVAHAHRSLVVHRDLKPSNVLVTREGEPKLLDFGIAKLLDDSAQADEAPATLTGNMMLTPEYSSPEQVRGEAVTTSTDVYALGVMLYELLSGARAQRRDNASMTELMRVVCDQSPPAPSVAIQRGPAEIPGHPEPRTRLARRLDGDLDTIIGSAMRKEPERRYATASALADDLERHLKGLPVAARADTFAYRARKFVARNRLAVFAAASSLTLLIVFAVVTARDKHTIEQQLQTIRDQNQTILNERDEAIRQRTVAQQIANFQESLFEMAELDPTRAETLRARELLDRGALRIAGELQDAPEIRAPLQLAMGRAYFSLGLYSDAEPLLLASERAFAQHEHDSFDHRLAQFWLGGVYMMLSRVDDGEALIRQSWQPLANGEDVHQIVEASRRATLAGWLRDQGRFEQAATMLAEARELAGGNLADALDDGLDLELAEATIRRDLGEPARARELATAALRRSIEQHGEGHGRQSRYHRELAQIELQLGNLDEARDQTRAALALARKWSGDEHPDVDACLFAVAMVEIDRADWPAAEKVLRDVLQRDEQRFGKQHPYPALTRGQLAMVLGHLGDLDAAERLFLETIAQQREVLPDDHPELATTIANLGSFYNRNRRLDEAAERFTEALAIRSKIYPAEHPTVLTARQQLAVVELGRGKAQLAEKLFREILAQRRIVRGEHVETAGSLLSLATCVARQRRHKEAIPLFAESVAMFRKSLPPEHPTLARVLCSQGVSHMRLNQASLAEPVLREAEQVRTKALGDDNFDTLYTRFWLVQSLAANRKFDEARQLGSRTLATLQDQHPQHGMTRAMQSVMSQMPQ